MNDESREELISAYIDGELSADERARVERWLAEDPRLRQLHDELRGLGGALRSLPLHKLERDLGPMIVRRAERAVLSGDQDVPESGQATSGGAISPSTLARKWWARGGAALDLARPCGGRRHRRLGF